MKSFAILVDTTADITPDICRRFEIDYIKGHLMLPDGSETLSTLEWDRMTKKAFYDALRRGDSYSTSPANITEFTEVLTRYAESGRDVLVLTISSGLSGTFGFATKAREAVLEKHPECNIKVVDTLRYSALEGLMAIYASNMRGEGRTLAETADWLEQNKNRFHQMGWLDDLSFVARQGRLTNSQAFFGKLIGIKPLGEIDYNGLTTVLGKAKGEKAGYDAILRYIERTIEKPEEQILFVASSDRDKQALVLRDKLAERFHPKEIIMTDVFPSCGVNVGPGLMAAYYLGKPISQGLEQERALMKEILGN